MADGYGILNLFCWFYFFFYIRECVRIFRNHENEMENYICVYGVRLLVMYLQYWLYWRMLYGLTRIKWIYICFICKLNKLKLSVIELKKKSTLISLVQNIKFVLLSYYIFYFWKLEARFDWRKKNALSSSELSQYYFNSGAFFNIPNYNNVGCNPQHFGKNLTLATDTFLKWCSNFS